MPSVHPHRPLGATGNGLCRDCQAHLTRFSARCPHCQSPQCLFHEELHTLSVAHIDCDAFFASVEKRDNPALRNRPVIVGGGARGVVSTACYLARVHGVQSAMPMFKARRACPQAIVLKPNMQKYATTARAFRTLLEQLTPQVQVVSIDEAYVDLRGTQRLHKKSPAQSLAGLAKKVEQELGITISIGLSHNKFLAKLASDMDKPRGFYVLGERDTLGFLAQLPIHKVPGIGRNTTRRFAQLGFTHLGQIQALSTQMAAQHFGDMGAHWRALAHGLDTRPVRSSKEPAKSMSTETTFAQDISSRKTLEQHLWRLTEKLARRCVESHIAGHTVQLKLRHANFNRYSRAQKLEQTTRLPRTIFRAARGLLTKTLIQYPRSRWRLLGVGLSDLVPAEQADLPNLFNPELQKELDLQQAIDRLRTKFGVEAIQLGRGLIAPTQHKQRNKEDSVYATKHSK